MLKVAITGGIGSGKSTIAGFFAKNHGIKVYKSDDHAHFLLNNNDDLIKEVKNLLGYEVYLNKTLITSLVSSKIFNDDDIRIKMQNIVFNYLKKDFEKWCLENENEKYILFESAILIETGIYKDFNKIIVVNTNVESRIERLVNNRFMTEEDSLSIIKVQISDSERIKYADYLINNDLHMINKNFNNYRTSNYSTIALQQLESSERKEQLCERIHQIHNKLMKL